VNEWSARLASALIGIISIPILYFSVHKLIGSGSALILSSPLAVSPWHLFWSQNARFYSSLMLMVLLNPIMFTKDRYVFMTLPSWLILAAMAIEQLVSQTRGLGKLLSAGVVVMLLAEAGGTNMLYYHVNNGGRRDWRAAFEIMKEESRDGDVFVAWWPEFSPYYLGREIIPWNDIHPDKVLESGKRYWFLVDSETIWGNSEMHQWIMDPAELIEVLLPGRSRGTFACRSRAGFWSTFGGRPGSNFRFCFCSGFWSSPSNRFGGSFSRGLRIALTFQKGDYFGRKIAPLSRVEVTQMQRSNVHTNDLHLLYYQEDD
jgi:hypothetical protein